jgi:hypothetical protein
VRLLLGSLLALAAVAPAAHAQPVACVKTVNSKGVVFSVCVPVDTGNSQCREVVDSSTPALPDVYVCLVS